MGGVARGELVEGGTDKREAMGGDEQEGREGRARGMGGGGVGRERRRGEDGERLGPGEQVRLT